MNSRDDELERAYQERLAQREEQYRESMRPMEKHPRIGLLPSPEIDTEGFSIGEDVTDTQNDFDQAFVWMQKINAFNEEFYEHYRGQVLKKGDFDKLINLASSMSFDAMRNTANPTLDEYVIWYYTGHGHAKSSNNTEKSSMPKLNLAGFDSTRNDRAKEYAKHL